MGWNKEFRPAADFFPLTTENPTSPGGVINTGKLTCVDLCIADGNDETTIASGASTRPFPRRLWYDASAQTSIRIVVDEVTVAGPGRLCIVFRDAVGGTDADAGDGGIEVSVPLSAPGPSKAGYAVINAAAQADVLFEVIARDGDGTAKVRGVHIQFLNGVVDLCGGDGGCPMPESIYNGDDFSAYANEAAFIALGEGEAENEYWVWYGDDGSVEGVSFDPTLKFCGNPVVVGRWKAVSSGSSTWDVTGFGWWTRFAQPGSGGSSSFPPRVGFASVWATIRLKIEAGWSADDGYGFTVSDVSHGGNGINGESLLLIRDGRLIFRANPDSSVGPTEYDIGPASMIVGTAGFMDVTIHGTMSDLGGGLWQIETSIFINQSCDVAVPGDVGSESATPLATHTATVVPTPIGGVVANLKFYDWDKFNYTTDTAQWPEKKIWVAQWFYSGSLT